jgi:hypothetical protein
MSSQDSSKGNLIMPKVTVAVDHHSTPEDVKRRAGPVIEKTVKDFEGCNLELTWDDMNATFKFKSLAFTISGTAKVDAEKITIVVDLPFAAIMFKDKAEKAIRKNLVRALETNA